VGSSPLLNRARRLAAGVEVDPDGLNLAHDTLLQADRKRVAAMDDRTAAFEK
jgi:hypothetical protein